MSIDLLVNLNTKHKLNDDEYSLMMQKFKKLNEQYNESVKLGVENICFKNLHYGLDILNLNDEDIFSIIDIAKCQLTQVNRNIININSKLKIYEEVLDQISIFKETIDKINKVYENLLSKSNQIECMNVFPISSYFKDEKANYVELLKNQIETKIDEIKEEFTLNANKIIRFKKLIIKAMPEEKIKNICNICNICAENTVNICINPCGHVFCNVCIDKMKNCGICRGKIDSKIKLYLDNNDNDNETENDEMDNIEPFIGFNNNLLINDTNNYSLV